MPITVDENVKKRILTERRDYRVCTACTGAALVPTTVKPSKANDIKIPIGDNFLYISAVQARYISRVTMDMLYDRNDITYCPAFY
ncbi:MAG TPA: hypothetical protein VJY42_00625 [Candidatus Methanomethylophilaceae archaeon]|nr:hypothetical protein [Candidatus Methanomethylophilaceae archaeon]